MALYPLMTFGKPFSQIPRGSKMRMMGMLRMLRWLHYLHSISSLLVCLCELHSRVIHWCDIIVLDELCSSCRFQNLRFFTTTHSSSTLSGLLWYCMKPVYAQYGVYLWLWRVQCHGSWVQCGIAQPRGYLWQTLMDTLLNSLWWGFWLIHVCCLVVDTAPWTISGYQNNYNDD